jgi:lipoprotein NlpD
VVATNAAPPPQVTLPTGPINWAWPSNGRILARFEESSVDKKGIDFDGNKGDPVKAAADGQIVYAGSGLLRYGDLIIIKHNDKFLSAYAHNDKILVKEGAFVKQGDVIAELGSSGIDRNMLHFEIRVEGTPVDPMQHLPSR